MIENVLFFYQEKCLIYRPERLIDANVPTTTWWMYKRAFTFINVVLSNVTRGISLGEKLAYKAKPEFTVLIYGNFEVWIANVSLSVHGYLIFCAIYRSKGYCGENRNEFIKRFNSHVQGSATSSHFSLPRTVRYTVALHFFAPKLEQCWVNSSLQESSQCWYWKKI